MFGDDLVKWYECGLWVGVEVVGVCGCYYVL